jgi:DNA-binding response OmpR family regulator
VTHPASGNAGPDEPTAPPRADGPAPPGGVLVVDDEEAVRRVVSRGMRSHGFAVWMAGDGREAVELYSRHRGAIDVVLLDVQMRDRDGPATLAALREVDPGVRCCFMTGDPGRYTEQVLAGLGAAAVFSKPFRMDEVARRLAQLAARNRRDDAFQGDRWEDDGGRIPPTPPSRPRGVATDPTPEGAT